MREAVNFTEDDMFSTFQKMSPPVKSDYDPIEKNYKRIYVLHQPEIFDEDDIMKLHVLNKNEGIIYKADRKLKEFPKDFFTKKPRGEKKEKLKPSKMRKSASGIMDMRSHSILARFEDLDVKDMEKYLKIVKGNKKPNDNSPKKPQYNKIDSISNFQFLDLIKSDSQKENSVDKYYQELKSYRPAYMSPLSAKNIKYSSNGFNYSSRSVNKNSMISKPNLSDIPVESTLSNDTKTRPATSRISNFFSQRQNKIPIEKTLKLNKFEKNISEQIDKNKKLRKLFSEVNRVKPNKSTDFDNYQVGNPFIRKEVYHDNLSSDKAKLGVKDYIFSLSKPKHKKELGNEKKIFSGNPQSYSLVKKCNKLIKTHSGILNYNSKSVDKEKKKYEVIKQKKKYGGDLRFINLIKKETANYNKKTGLFIYGDLEGYKYHNIERLYAGKYDSRRKDGIQNKN